ncbi:hypothetical protein N7532_001304 [Penicillium argentinense]|uniref:Polynucleotide adenylyltransferase n=1 Tax=Penicillium argentinense TaxID=1131581 RepID=A0A9W9G272_9EURO|nr:uncharacterized protein N7532_001304 [Penicillium argentinense]KAJ5110769.1 hypothetical protein N7532_001304 [Penicillium argentinense]
MRLPALRSRLALPPRQPRAAHPAQDVDVFANNLRKTLDAHRTSNRARLVRRVYPRAPPAGFWRLEIPPESRAGYQPPTPPVLAPKDLEPKEAVSRRRRRTRNGAPEAHSEANCTEYPSIRDSGSSHNGQTEYYPWLGYLAPSAVPGDAAAYLDAEIHALEQYLAPTCQEQNRINQLNAQIASLLGPVVPHTPQLIGSRQIGLALTHSDLDFFLRFDDLPRASDRLRRPSATRPQIQDAHLRLLHRVKSTLQYGPLSCDRIRLTGKRQPVLEARHQPTGLLLRFHCGESTPAIMEYLRNCLAEYPSLRPLYVVTRTLLEARSLFGSAQSSIRPDALAMLLVAFFKLSHGRSSRPRSLSEQLLAFLHFYGTTIDLQSIGIAIEPPGFFGAEKAQNTVIEDIGSACRRGRRSLINAKRTAVSRGNMAAGQRLCIQDPTHYMNDLGRSCTRTAELQIALATAHQKLRHTLDNWQGTYKTDSILACALQADFNELEKLREQITSSNLMP